MIRQIVSVIRIFVACFIIFTPPTFAFDYSHISDTDQPYAPTRLIVKFTPAGKKTIESKITNGNVATGIPELDHLFSEFNVHAQTPLLTTNESQGMKSTVFDAVYILTVPAGTDLVEMKQAFEKRPEIEYAELDYVVSLFGTIGDPLSGHQWYLHNIGALQNDGAGYLGIDRDADHVQVMKFGTEDADIDALEAFVNEGEKAIPIVGIIDTGIDTDHEDLAPNIWVNPGEDLNGDGHITPDEINGLDDDHNGFVDDVHGWDFSGDDYVSSLDIVEDNVPADSIGHGTHCAGIVGAVRNNATGVAGIASPVKIMAVKIFPNAYFSVSAKAIIYAANMGCDIINLSWGGPHYSNLVEDAVDYALAHGTLPIAASGNTGLQENFFPASLKQLLTVGASNSDDEVTFFSTYGEQVDVVAPGRDILSLRAAGTDMYAGNGYPETHIVAEKYYLADGTSMAAPCVTGIAAYLLAVSPGTDILQVMDIIEQSAEDIVYPYGGDSLASPGIDIYSGHGRVNLNSALSLLSGTLADITYPYENAIFSGDMAIIGTASGPAFSGFQLEYGRGYEPSIWTEIALSETPVSGDTLGLWSTTGLNGLYTLRLTVGGYNHALRRIILANGQLVEILKPTDGSDIKGLVQVTGNTIIPDFAEYSLEYGEGAAPVQWITAVHSTEMIADDTVGSFIVNFINASECTIRLTVRSIAGETFTNQITCPVQSITTGSWVRPLTERPSLAPGVGDIDGDGYDEIIVGVGGPDNWDRVGGVEVYDHLGQCKTGWPRNTDENMQSPPAIGDIDGDAVDDIIICSEQAGVRAYLSGSPDWNNALFTGGYYFGLAAPVIADLEDDGSPEVFVVNKYGDIYAWRADGQPVLDDPTGLFGQTAKGGDQFGWPSLAIVDLDRDGANEVVVGSAMIGGTITDGIFIFDANGQGGGIEGDFNNVAGIAIANVDDSSDLEIVTVGANENYFTVSAFKKDGSQAVGYPLELTDLKQGNWFANYPAVGDLDGDGALELIITAWTLGEGRIYAWHQDGTPLGSITDSTQGQSYPAFARVTGAVGSPILADINGSGSAEIIVRTGSGLGSDYDKVYAWDINGDLVPGFPLYASPEAIFANYIPYVPVIADTDKDGYPEMILGAGLNEFHIVSWEFGNQYDHDMSPWPRLMHDSWNSDIHGFEPHQDANRPPYGLRVDSYTATSVTLGWVAKAPHASSGYNLYRSNTADELGQRLNIVPIPRQDSLFTDTTPEQGVTCFYAMTTIDTLGDESVSSAQISFRTGVPDPPKLLAASANDYVVTLTWQLSPPDYAVDKYHVYCIKPLFETLRYLGTVYGDTIFADSSTKMGGKYKYWITAENHIDQSEISDTAAITLAPPPLSPPYGLNIADWIEDEVDLLWINSQDGTPGSGGNLYRSQQSGKLIGPPINSSLIGDADDHLIEYTDTMLMEGETYYYAVTQIIDHWETHPSAQLTFKAGRPHRPTLTARSGADLVSLQIEARDNDLKGFVILRQTDTAPFEIIENMFSGQTYTDYSTEDDFAYHYQVLAIDTFDLKSDASSTVEGCHMLFDRGMAVVDMTSGLLYPHLDTLSAFYDRLLSDYSYTAIDRNFTRPILTLYDIHHYPMLFVHSDDKVSSATHLYKLSLSYPALGQFLQAGGVLFIAGRGLFSSPDMGIGSNSLSPGDFLYDYMHLDSIYITDREEIFDDYDGFIGALNASTLGAFPAVAEIDTARINAVYGSLPFDMSPGLSGVDRLYPQNRSDIIYTFMASDTMCEAQGTSVGISINAPEARIICLTFPLYFIKENTAKDIVRSAIEDLGLPTDLPGDESEVIPREYALRQNHPNPFNPTTRIRFAIPRADNVRIEVFNIAGQKVSQILDDYLPAGEHEIFWDGRNVDGRAMASGIYFYRMKTGNFSETRKMLLLK